jgi:hypothetical protein
MARFNGDKYIFNFSDKHKNYICNYCGEVCQVVTVDYGVGHDDAYGCPGIFHDYRQASDCCESTYTEISEK